ncbi:MAG: hypothetical protein WCV88_00625 [Patescibacteria group bacterium]|jgi:hypothetical protein
MGDFEETWLDDSFSEDAEASIADPFDGLTRRDQDIFFKVLDIVPDTKREAAMDYFLDHPQKIRAVVAGVKLQKKMLAEKDVTGLNKLFEQEHVLFQDADIATVAGVTNNNEEDNDTQDWG